MNDVKKLNLTVASSPHVASPIDTQNLMRDVLIALVPALVFGVVFFGPRALVATIISVLAWIGILIYMSVRFKWDYALSAIVALIHDVLIILAFCAIFRLEINTEIVAVLLTIIGYSVNNSIVVFDRIRDRVRAHRGRITKEEYRELVNEAIQATCTRSVFSTLTTMLPVIFLLLMGSGAIFVFNLTLLIGLIAGAGSSLFIAAQLWYQLRLREKPKKVKKVKRSKKELDEMIVPGVND